MIVLVVNRLTVLAIKWQHDLMVKVKIVSGASKGPKLHGVYCTYSLPPKYLNDHWIVLRYITAPVDLELSVFR